MLCRVLGEVCAVDNTLGGVGLATNLASVNVVSHSGFVADNGDPHAGAISASPDVILRTAQEANPQTAFGEVSGTENSQTLGFEAEAGQDNFI
jgi:hypothetical protein